MNSVLPANSAVMRDLSASYGSVQLIISVYLLATLVAQLVLGQAADHYGRRPIMLLGLFVFGVGGFLCAISPSIEWLLFGRFVQGFGASVCMLLPRAIIRDVFSRDRAASKIGYMTTAMMVAPLFGPMLGGWVSDNLSWRLMYAGLGVSAFIAATLCYLYLHETMATKDADYQRLPFLKAAAVLLLEKEFLGVCMMMTGGIGIYYCFLGSGPFLGMEVREMSATSYGRWFAMVGIGYLTGNFIAGRYSTAVGAVKMAQYGQIPMVIGVLLFWAFLSWSHPLSLFLPMLLVALSNGISLPNMASVAMSVKPELSASASGLSGSLQLLFGVLMTGALGSLLPMSVYWFYWFVTAGAVVCIYGLMLLRGAQSAAVVSEVHH